MAAGDEPGGFLEINYSVPPALPLESVLFIGTQFSILPLHRSGYASRSRVVVCMMCACLYVNVCSDVLGSLSL